MLVGLPEARGFVHRDGRVVTSRHPEIDTRGVGLARPAHGMRDRWRAERPPSARSELLKVDAMTTPNDAESGRVVATAGSVGRAALNRATVERTPR